MLDNINNETEDYNTATIKVKDCLKGFLQADEEVKIIERGDGFTRISKYVENSGGYLNKNDQVLLFISRDEKYIEKFSQIYNGENMPYTYHYQGKYWIDDDKIISKIKSKTDSHNLFKDCKRVNDIKQLIKEISDKVKGDSTASEFYG